MKFNTLDEKYDFLTDVIGIPKGTIGLVIALNGYNTETLEKILFYYTGWRSFEGFCENEMEDYLQSLEDLEELDFEEE